MAEQVALQRISQFGFQNHCIVASVRMEGVLGIYFSYGPPIASHISEFWKNMTSYAQEFNGPKCFIGDFNAIVSNEEKFGGLPVLNYNISYFNDFIQMNHLIDLGYKGPSYTWTNGREIDGLIMQRLDRVLANTEWFISFHNVVVLHLPRIIKNPAALSAYHPIYLCNVLYKIVAKILSNRIKPYLEEFICWSQSAFVPGRQILDNIIIAKELLHSMNNSGAVNGHFALKVDMVKAYDRVNWRFLGDMLHVMGINGKTHLLIMACVISISFSININGSPQGFFKSERGIRQGCPLSPSLFIICSQGISILMNQFESQGLYQGYKINRWAPTITHLMFADDLFFFGEHSRINVLNMKKLLDQYASLSGQMTNYNKSAIYFSKGISDLRRQTTIQDLGVREMVSDVKYLGIFPLKSDYRVASYDYLVDKFNSRFPGWRFHYTNMAGRTILLKTSLSSIPIYCMGICLLPKGVTQEIDKIMRCFWWGHNTDEKNYNSSIGRSLLEVRKYLLNNVIWQISNGMDIKIWDNPWVPQLMDHIITKPVDAQIHLQKVSDLILPNCGDWNLELLEDIFSPEVVGNITSIYISHDYISKDVLVWKCTPSAKFVPNTYTTCTLCGQEDESVIHLLFFCARAKLVFDAAGLGSDLSVRDITVMEIVRNCIEDGSTEEFVKRMCTLWNIWKTRNDILFSQGNFSISHTLKNINKYFQLCMENFKENNVIHDNIVHTWSPPNQHFIKINVDAAFIPNNGAAGAIAKDCNGRFLVCASRTFYCTSSLLAETIACRLGLELGLRHNFPKFIIEGDASNVIVVVLGESRDIPWSISSEVLRIKDYAGLFDDIKFEHVRKSANHLAHKLCQHVFHDNVNNWWNANYPPLCISANLNFEVVQ
ncbi:uncharacterized protein LOC113306024 [Papaver somniferum]|uniref:uncharacterized protein LOC113306024 n=1 Tax=Papaver somniferum TaxID=3469 RepID=UPI000E702DA4|nr:uncharacterized protein LOC113306024 [Papaver somniferum]